MTKLLSRFEALEGFEGIYTATRANLRCTALRLRSGGLCLFSPVKGLGNETIASLQELGQVEILLAPNHWHNMGLREYVEAFPGAALCASARASVRLSSVTQLHFEGLGLLEKLLPENMQMLVPEGLKTGEVWLSITDGQRCAWAIVDAFCGPGANKHETDNGPAILGTFPKFGLGDRVVYVDWLKRQIEADKPTMMVPCHGAVLRDGKLPDKLRRLVADKL